MSVPLVNCAGDKPLVNCAGNKPLFKCPQAACTKCNGASQQDAVSVVISGGGCTPLSDTLTVKSYNGYSSYCQWTWSGGIDIENVTVVFCTAADKYAALVRAICKSPGIGIGPDGDGRTEVWFGVYPSNEACGVGETFGYHTLKDVGSDVYCQPNKLKGGFFLAAAWQGSGPEYDWPITNGVIATVSWP
jgi:hypothetical protein